MNTLAHIEQITVGRLDKQTSDTFAKLEYMQADDQPEAINKIKENYMRLMGYNPGDPLKNKQICSNCGKHGYQCAGHPIKINLGVDYLSPFHTKMLGVLFRTFCAGCGHVVRLPNRETEKDIFILGKSLRRVNYKNHTFCSSFVHVKATVYEPKTKVERKRR